MNNCSVVSVGGPDAAINAMNNEAVQRYLSGVNNDDPSVFLEKLEEMVQVELAEEKSFSNSYAYNCAKPVLTLAVRNCSSEHSLLRQQDATSPPYSKQKSPYRKNKVLWVGRDSGLSAMRRLVGLVVLSIQPMHLRQTGTFPARQRHKDFFDGMRIT